MNSLIYQENIEALRQKYPQLYQRVLEASDQQYLEIVPSRSNLPTLKVNGIFFHSAYYPLREVDYYMPTNFSKNTDIVVFIGFGLGYQVRNLWSRPTFSGKIVIIEKDIAIFKKALESFNFVPIINDQSVLFLIGETKEDIISALEKSGFFTINIVNTEVVVHAPSVNVYGEYYNFILQKVRSAVISCRTNFETFSFFQHTWYQNSSEIIVDVAASPGVNKLTNIFSGLPGIVVSAGPSLTKCLPMLKQIKGKVPIFSVGTTFKLLCDNGIVPDFVTVVDADKVIMKQFINTHSHGSILICADFMPKELIDMFKPNLFFFSCGMNNFSQLLPIGQRDKGKLYPGGSVSHIAVDAAVQFGCDPVILVGQDLAFEGETTYAKGTMWEDDRAVFSNEEEFKRKGYVKVKGNYQDKVNTSVNFRTFIDNYERYISCHPEITFINAISAGAFIPGTKVMTAEQAFDKYCLINDNVLDMNKVYKIIEDYAPNWNEFKKNIKKIIPELNNVIKDLKMGYEKTKKLKDLFLAQTGAKKTEQIQEIAKSLDRLSTKLKENQAMQLLGAGPGAFKLLAMDIYLRTSDIKLEGYKKFSESVYEVYENFLESAEYIHEKFKDILKRSDSWEKKENTKKKK